MSDTQTPVVEQKTQPPMNQKGPATHEQKQKRRKLIRTSSPGIKTASVSLYIPRCTAPPL